ncbi:hypothetical protein NL676_035278 [Syzygium grande]|nr:hypothetical protein NL676_035278 [Syzygium grande]
MESPPPPILLSPYPVQGHMLPRLDLTHQLSLRRLALIVLVTPKNLPLLNPLLSAHPFVLTLISKLSPQISRRWSSDCCSPILVTSKSLCPFGFALHQSV